ncbi:MAG: hypothetical protein EOP45_00090 [Sphingobacteriaceae bacterium]|nr:MAG: hypothetical protein EOP45_00090 [Sphingobacteriaceae bacterium]
MHLASCEHMHVQPMHVQPSVACALVHTCTRALLRSAMVCKGVQRSATVCTGCMCTPLHNPKGTKRVLCIDCNATQNA